MCLGRVVSVNSKRYNSIGYTILTRQSLSTWVDVLHPRVILTCIFRVLTEGLDLTPEPGELPTGHASFLILLQQPFSRGSTVRLLFSKVQQALSFKL